MNKTLAFRKTHVLDLLNCSDVDWAGIMNNERSTTGFCFILNELSVAICWVCKAQTNEATSTAKSELNSVVKASKKAIRLGGILDDLEIIVSYL